MPGVISPDSVVSAGAIAGMKRPHAPDAQQSNGNGGSGGSQPDAKKRKVVVRQLQHTQHLEHVVDPISAEFGDFGDSKDFFDQQLRRAIAIQCKVNGFDTAQPDALEGFRGLVDSYMTGFLAKVRKSMIGSRRTEPIPHDWIYALSSSGLRGSAALDSHFDTGDVPPSILAPQIGPPEPAEPPPVDLEPLLGPELSGKADKEARSYIPKHFPPFPSKHTYKSTPVFADRETDPRKIREKATEEGILAEQSLRKLMAAHKSGLQKQRTGKGKLSKRMKESNKLWQVAMADVLAEEKEREKDEERQRAREEAEDDDWNAPLETQLRQPTVDRNVNLDEGVHVNYEQRFWRKSARAV